MRCEEERQGERGVKQAIRRAFLHQIASQYQQACTPHKKRLLEGFLNATGFVRKDAIWLLNHAEDVLQTGEQDHR